MSLYTIYIKEDCQSCDRVLDYVSRLSVEYRVISLDKEEKKHDVPVQIVPALFDHATLKAYGADIIKYFKKRYHFAY